tara:strand:+ start:52 stop:264 length:213 start_codon:yes stop_codon:yes gene_type:complete
MNGAPKFSKIELLIKSGDSTNNIEYRDCGMVITGNYIIIVGYEGDSKAKISSTGTIYNISEIVKYKTQNY